MRLWADSDCATIRSLSRSCVSETTTKPWKTPALISGRRKSAPRHRSIKPGRRQALSSPSTSSPCRNPRRTNGSAHGDASSIAEPGILNCPARSMKSFLLA